MSGPAMQLHCYRGAASRAFACSTGSTMFRGTYRKVTPFAYVDVVDSGQRETLKNSSGAKRVVIGRNGDLLANAYLEINLPAPNSDDSYIRNVGMAFIKNVQLKIGTQIIDEYTQHEANIHEELIGKAGKELTEMTLNVGAHSVRHEGFGMQQTSTGPAITQFQSGAEQLFHRSQNPSDSNSGTVNCYVPLCFWFCQSASQALPLVSLMYHEVSLVFDLRKGTASDEEFLTRRHAGVDVSEVGTPITEGTAKCNVVYSYVLLSSEEREAMANATFEQLLVQHQRQQATSKSLSTARHEYSISLNFNHPVTALFWIGRVKAASADEKYTMTSDVFDYRGYYSGEVGYHLDPFCECQLNINNQRRFASNHKPQYFRLVQPYQHFNKVPQENMIYCYSFAAAPALWCQPSGHLNWSRIDSSQLVLKTNPAEASDTIDIMIFALNLNILRYSGGLGGARYSV